MNVICEHVLHFSIGEAEGVGHDAWMGLGKLGDNPKRQMKSGNTGVLPLLENCFGVQDGSSVRDSRPEARFTCLLVQLPELRLPCCWLR